MAHIRASRVPEITTRLCASFQLEPEWLDEKEARDVKELEKHRDGFKLEYLGAENWREDRTLGPRCVRHCFVEAFKPEYFSEGKYIV